MKHFIPLLFTMVSSQIFGQVEIAKIVECTPGLAEIASSQQCRQFSELGVSKWNAKENSILIDEGGRLRTMPFPEKEIAERLAFQLTTTIDEGFYNSETKEWIVFNYPAAFGKSTVAIIPQDQNVNRGQIHELYSFTNKIHKNVSFLGKKILVNSDDMQKSISFERDLRTRTDMIAEGMKAHLHDENLADTDMFTVMKEWMDKCGHDVKCLGKMKKETIKKLKKDYKTSGNKEAVEYLKHYSPFEYRLNQYKEYLDGCVANPHCRGMVGGNEKAFYRVNYNMDNGEKALSLNHFMPEAFSILYNYIPLEPLK